MDLEILIPAVLLISGVFFTISSVILAIRHLKIKNTPLSVLFFINACLPISFIVCLFMRIYHEKQGISQYEILESIVLLIFCAIPFFCVVDLIVIFILPLLSRQKIVKDIENKTSFGIWCLSFLMFFGVSIPIGTLLLALSNF